MAVPDGEMPAALALGALEPAVAPESSESPSLVAPTLAGLAGAAAGAVALVDAAMPPAAATIAALASDAGAAVFAETPEGGESSSAAEPLLTTVSRAVSCTAPFESAAAPLLPTVSRAVSCAAPFESAPSPGVFAIISSAAAAAVALALEGTARPAVAVVAAPPDGSPSRLLDAPASGGAPAAAMALAPSSSVDASDESIAAPRVVPALGNPVPLAICFAVEAKTPIARSSASAPPADTPAAVFVAAGICSAEAALRAACITGATGGGWMPVSGKDAPGCPSSTVLGVADLRDDLAPTAINAPAKLGPAGVAFAEPTAAPTAGLAALVVPGDPDGLTLAATDT